MKRIASIIYTVVAIAVLLGVIGYLGWTTYVSFSERMQTLSIKTQAYTENIANTLVEKRNIDEELALAEQIVQNNALLIALQIHSHDDGLRLSVVKPSAQDLRSTPITDSDFFSKILNRFLYRLFVYPMDVDNMPGLEASFIVTVLSSAEIQNNLLIILITVVILFILTLVMIFLQPRDEVFPEHGSDQLKNDAQEIYQDDTDIFSSEKFQASFTQDVKPFENEQDDIEEDQPFSDVLEELDDISTDDNRPLDYIEENQPFDDVLEELDDISTDEELAEEEIKQDQKLADMLKELDDINTAEESPQEVMEEDQPFPDVLEELDISDIARDNELIQQEPEEKEPLGESFKEILDELETSKESGLTDENNEPFAEILDELDDISIEEEFRGELLEDSSDDELLAMPSEEPIAEEISEEVDSDSSGETHSQDDLQNQFIGQMESELERSASLNQDLAILLYCCDEVDDEVIHRAYESNGLVFTLPGSRLGVLVNNLDLDQAMADSEHIIQDVMKRNANAPIRTGISARNGRLISAKRLYHEAEEALKKTDKENPIVAFRSDPEKYMAMLKQQN